ncbi:hypothetical protein ZOSMA_107G00820 [Zostera marina]|uniref:MI domain-containing protein n=1 Tax=Zostera marina TaxID=29655 RepID=A0A0K9Q4H5_ZOSMR|nr:hypothetical protein ZOSMA_107G00820 [Zostera marina]
MSSFRRNIGKHQKKMRPKKKTKFEEYLEMESGCGAEDIETERKLAKRLKVKGGKLSGFDDGMNDLFDGIPSIFDSSIIGDENVMERIEKGDNSSKSIMKKKRKRKKLSCVIDTGEKKDEEVVAGGSDEEKKVGPTGEAVITVEKKPEEAVKAYVAPHLRDCGQNNDSEDLSHVRRRVRGLLNRLSESNLESIVQEIASLLRSVSRGDGCQIIQHEVLSSVSNGPRGNEQYAAVFAAFVAGMACSIGIDFSAKLIASLAALFEDEYTKEDNLSLRNITLLLCYLCIFGVCSSDLIYDFLSVLSKRLTELDVSTILSVLQCCGMKLRSDDPISMKDFILDIQNRVTEVKSISSRSGDTQPKLNSKRMEFMLETICDIKNNKKRSKDEPAPHMRIKKWLQKLKSDDILLRGLKWAKLLDREKKGQWWFSGEIDSTVEHVEEVASTIDREITETQKLMKLAASQRMNTDVRRAIFCIIISAEDYVDAFEKLLRLDLTGKQDREIMRVLVECCLQESIFNKYYVVLASKLCSHDKNHKFTLQYCLWDHFKELDTMELRRSMNLAKFVSEMLCSFTMSISILKTVDFTDPKKLTPRWIVHFRMLFEMIFEKTDANVWNVFSRVATIPEQEVLSQNFEFFIKKFVISNNSSSSEIKKSLAGKFKITMKALHNTSGVLM